MEPECRPKSTLLDLMRHSSDAESISGNANLAANFEYWCTQFRLRQGERYLWAGLMRPARRVVDNRFIQLFDKAAIGGRRYPKPGLERPAELAGIIEAAGQGDGGDFMPGLA